MQFSAPSLAVSNEASLTGKKRRCWSPGSARALLSSGFLSQHPVKLQPGSSLLTGGRGRLCSCWCVGVKDRAFVLERTREGLPGDSSKSTERSTCPPGKAAGPRLSPGAQCKHPGRLLECPLAFGPRTNSPSLSAVTPPTPRALTGAQTLGWTLRIPVNRKQFLPRWVYYLPGESGGAHKRKNKATQAEQHITVCTTPSYNLVYYRKHENRHPDIISVGFQEPPSPMLVSDYL